MLPQTNVEVLTQLTDLLGQMSDEQYKKPLKQLHDNSIGQHVRHIVEFYQCLLRGYISGTVNYDNRERKAQIETDRYFTLQVLEAIIGKLTFWEEDKMLMLATSYDGEELLEIPTSFNRELVYLIEHTIHHLAIIKIGLNEAFPTIEIPENFGVAYSTIRFKEK